MLDWPSIFFELVQSPDLRGYWMGQQGRERARTLFSESHMHARYLSLYREIAPWLRIRPRGLPASWSSRTTGAGILRVVSTWFGICFTATGSAG